ncbi:MAG: ThiF family adenylyltransferase [Bacteroidota bacterium]
MLEQLIISSPDLKQLRTEGYEIEYKGGYLLIHHIPYINSSRELKYGILVTELTLANNSTTARPHNHVIHFIGDHPCDREGQIITQISHSSQNKRLYDGVVTNHSFSNKPADGYPDYYQKVSTYAGIISAPAKSLDKNVTEKTFRVLNNLSEDDVFQYVDTNSSRAEINLVNSKFIGQKVAVIGLGGTGAYILDLVSKTPVKEIHLFDGDKFHQHNAFRSPGAASNEDLNKLMDKVEYYFDKYSKMHKFIIPHSEYVTEDNFESLRSMSYVFICVDKNEARKKIIDTLLLMGIPFFDVGLGVNLVDDKLIGMVRTTTGTPTSNAHLPSRIPEGDDENNEYATNIQIADLNALNAVLAVLKWKKMSGFYQDLKEEHHSTYSINVAQLLNADTTA